MKAKYIKPERKVITIESHAKLLAGSNQVGVYDEVLDEDEV